MKYTPTIAYFGSDKVGSSTSGSRFSGLLMTFLISFGPGREYFLRVQSTSVELVQAPINLNIMERLVMNSDAARHVQAYIEYE
jgi:hypothetical protein